MPREKQYHIAQDACTQAVNQALARLYIPKGVEKNPQFTEQDLVYAAGFFDGEGYAGIVRRNTKSGYIYRIFTHVTNTDSKICALFARRFGGNWGLHTAGTLRRKPSYRWRASNQIAVRFLTAIRPYLRVKRKQVEVVLEFSTLVGNRGRLTATNIAKREQYYQQIRKLNQRGGQNVQRDSKNTGGGGGLLDTNCNTDTAVTGSSFVDSTHR